jgi:hypothetical protein
VPAPLIQGVEDNSPNQRKPKIASGEAMKGEGTMQEGSVGAQATPDKPNRLQDHECSVLLFPPSCFVDKNSKGMQNISCLFLGRRNVHGRS